MLRQPSIGTRVHRDKNDHRDQRQLVRLTRARYDDEWRIVARHPASRLTQKAVGPIGVMDAAQWDHRATARVTVTRRRGPDISGQAGPSVWHRSLRTIEVSVLRISTLRELIEESARGGRSGTRKQSATRRIEHRLGIRPRGLHPAGYVDTSLCDHSPLDVGATRAQVPGEH